MKRLRSIFIVVAIFVSGMIVGGIGAGTAAMNKIVKDTIRDPVNSRRLLVKVLKHELRLDEDQTHQAWQILNELGADLSKASVRPQVEEALKKAELRIIAVLNEHQKGQFNEFMQASRTRWQAAIAGIEPTEEAKGEKPRDVKVEQETPPR